MLPKTPCNFHAVRFGAKFTESPFPYTSSKIQQTGSEERCFPKGEGGIACHSPGKELAPKGAGPSCRAKTLPGWSPQSGLAHLSPPVVQDRSVH